MSWKNTIRKFSDARQLDFVIKTLESSKIHFDSMFMLLDSNSDDSVIRNQIKMIDEAITYTKEIKEKLQ
tara:strand:+ start:425 stop:631 length:207 start_codon:yes stop_codon:yes gene_type:complete